MSCRGLDDDDDETSSTDEPLWTPGTGPAAGMDDLFTGSGTVLPAVSPSIGAGGCLTSPGLGLGMADYFHAPSSSHGAGDVEMLRADVTDSVLSAAEVASMMCGTPSGHERPSQPSSGRSPCLRSSTVGKSL